MIKIMTEFCKVLVHYQTNGILQTVDFGGDVLTNQREFLAQCAMKNGCSQFERLSGLSHRPGGLHLLMNLTVVYCS